MRMETGSVTTMEGTTVMVSTMPAVCAEVRGPFTTVVVKTSLPGSVIAMGNLPDGQGNCQTFMEDTDGDGFYDTLLNPCLDQSNVPYYGEEYETVAIGNQCWFQQNLNTVAYRNGDFIDNIQDETAWGEASQGAYCYYDNDAANGATYGALQLACDRGFPEGLPAVLARAHGIGMDRVV